MTINIYQLKDSRKLRMGSQFEPHTIDYRFVVEECDDGSEGFEYTLTNPQAVLKAFGAFNGLGGLRFQVGKSLDKLTDSTWNPVEPYTEYGMWLVRSAEAAPHNDKAHTYTVTISLTNMGRLFDADQNAYVGDIQCSVNTSSNFKLKQAWRANVSPSKDNAGNDIDRDLLGADLNTADVGTASGLVTQWAVCPDEWLFCHTGQDIGGNDISYGMAQPVKVATRNTQISFEFVVRGQIEAYGASSGDDATFLTPDVNAYNASPYLNLQLLESYIGRRNADAIGQYEKGYLLCTAVDVQPLHYEFKRVVMTFVYDEWAHAEQRPWSVKDGPIIAEKQCDSVDIPDGEKEIINLTANSVGWLQPYLTAFSFGNTPQAIFPDDVWEDFFWKMGADPASYALSVGGNC